jgi:hypothetical protein
VPALRFEYDELADVLTVEGVNFSGDFFRAFAVHVGLTLTSRY